MGILPLQPEPSPEGQGADGPPLPQGPKTEERGTDAEGEDHRPGPEHPGGSEVRQLVHHDQPAQGEQREECPHA